MLRSSCLPQCPALGTPPQGCGSGPRYEGGLAVMNRLVQVSNGFRNPAKPGHTRCRKPAGAIVGAFEAFT